MEKKEMDGTPSSRPLMKAAVLEGIKNIQLRQMPIPMVRPGTILLRVRACGICGSDMKFYNYGDRVPAFPQILGHEVSGEVVDVGKEVTQFSVGQRLALANEIPCQKCQACMRGLENVCNNTSVLGVTLPGGFGEYVLLTEEMVQRGPINPMPAQLSFEEGALAEPLGCVVNGLEFARMEEGKDVLVIGAGPIGCLMINLSRILGARKIVVVEKNPKRLEMTRAFGADHLVFSENNDFEKEVLSLSNQKGYDVVMSACSDSGAHQKAIASVAKGGFVNLFGGVAKGLPDSVTFSNNFIHYRQAAVGGSFSQTRAHHRRALDYLSSGQIKTNKLITHTFPIEEAVKGIETVQQQTGLKVMIVYK